MKISTFPAIFRRRLRPRMSATLAPLLSLALVAPAMAWTLSAEVTLNNNDGNRVGRASLTQRGGDEVVVEVRVRDLPPGFHGFHVHAIGKCTEPSFDSAGAHFNLNPKRHPNHGDHSGDFPVLLVTADGTAKATFSTARFSLAELFDADGSALITHADADNYANIPDRYAANPDAATLRTGDSGGRIACGVIEKVIRRDKDR